MKNNAADSIPTVVFAKIPLPGYAKTRLIPALGKEGAARLARQLLQSSVQTAVKADLGPVILAAAPSSSHPQWGELALPASLYWRDQEEGDLGTRLSHMAQWALSTYQKVLMIGTDCPELTADVLHSAADRLRESDACMIPVADGGYALIGLSRFDEQIFKNIPWSTPQVAAKTRQCCARIGWKLAELPMLHDIDEPCDLQWLPDG